MEQIKYTDIKDPNSAEIKKMNEFEDGPWSHLNLDEIILPPPANDSAMTQHELKALSQLPEDAEFVRKYDDIHEAFENYYNEIGADFPSEIVEKAIKETAPVILKLKYYYDRPRPYQLAREYDIDLGVVLELQSMRTPSYPSGHSTQGYYIAYLLKDNGGPSGILKVAQNISRSRNIARAHYASDSAAGRELASTLLENRKD